jgi:hypothetical protein
MRAMVPTYSTPSLLRRASRYCLLLVVLCPFMIVGQPCSKNPQLARVLFIGNSYTYVNDLPALVRNLASSGGNRPAIETDMVAVGGADLVRLYKETDAVARIRKGCWDYVVLQEQSQLDGYVSAPQGNSPDAFYWGVRAFDKEIRARGAHTILYLTWPRKDVVFHYDLLVAAFSKMAKETGAKIAPVGPAWERAIQERPAMNLHAADGSHPNPYGSYLAACVFFAALTGRSPEGLAAGNIPAADGAFLQRIAWRTVQEVR